MLASRAAGNVKVDGAILGTPNHTHVPLGIQMLEAGVHALVEKVCDVTPFLSGSNLTSLQPVSTDVESGRALVAAAAQSDYKILVGHHRRFNPYIIAAKKIIDDGRVGQGAQISDISQFNRADGVESAGCTGYLDYS